MLRFLLPCLASLSKTSHGYFYIFLTKLLKKIQNTYQDVGLKLLWQLRNVHIQFVLGRAASIYIEFSEEINIQYKGRQRLLPENNNSRICKYY